MPKSSKAKSSRAESEFGGSQTSYAPSDYSLLEVPHLKEHTCKSCRTCTGIYQNVLWKTCMKIDPTEESCGNVPRRGGSRGGRRNLCKSCLTKSIQRKRSYAKTCQNPHFNIKNCLETPLVTTHSQAGGSGRELGEDSIEGDVAVRSIGGGDQVVGEEFAGLMRDLDALDSTGRFEVPSDRDGTMLGSMGGAGDPDDYGNMMTELNDLDPHGTVAEPSGGIVDFMTFFDQHVTEHGTLRDP